MDVSWGRGRTGWDELGMWDVGWEEGGGGLGSTCSRAEKINRKNRTLPFLQSKQESIR